MSEAQAGESSRDKRAWAEEVLKDILGHMGVRARLEVKEVEGEQPSISVALFLEEEIPGVTQGKRSQVIDSLQFLVNKIVNRGSEKRWVNIGVGGHPEPRGPKEKQEPKPKAEKPQPEAKAQPAAKQQQPQKKQAKGRGQEAKQGQAKPRAEREPDEATLEVADDPAMAALGRALAEKSAAFGRIYAVTAVPSPLRVQLGRGAEGIAGVRIKTEGEGRHRRLVFVPDNPRPMPKKSAMPDYDDEDELEG